MPKIAAALNWWRADAATSILGLSTMSQAVVGPLSQDDVLTPLITVSRPRTEARVFVEPQSPAEERRPQADPVEAHPDALRLAVRLLAEPAPGPGRVLLFGGVSRTRSARALLAETARALLPVVQQPLLLVDLRDGDAEDDVFAAWPIRDVADICAAVLTGKTGFPAAAGVGVAQAAVGGRDDLAFLASAQFVQFVAAARQHFGAVLFHASPLPDAVGGLIVARHCDHVVLSVPEGSTLSAARTAIDQLRRVNAHVLGLVLERMEGSDRSTRRQKGSRL